MLRYSASTEVSPSFRQYLDSTSAKIQQWMHNNGLNNFKVEDWHQFIGEQWKSHVLAAWVTVKSKDLKFLRSLLQDFLVHGRDHALMRSSFSAGTCTGKSFVTPLVINKSIDPFLCHQYLFQQSKQRWLQRYPWGISSRTSSLPVAYILFKAEEAISSCAPDH